MLELRYDSSTAVSYEDPEGIVPTTASVALYSADGASVQSPTVTKPTLSTTVQALSTATSLILGSVTGLVRGDRLAVTSAGVTYVVECIQINSTTKTVTLITALPVTPTAGDVVKNLKMTATLTAVGVAGLGSGYRLVWTYTDGTNARQHGVEASVVRWPWDNPCTPSMVREIVSEMNGGSRSETWCSDVADVAGAKIAGRIQQTQRRPWLYLTSDVFADVARAAVRYELSLRGIAMGGQIYEAQRELRFAFDDSLATVITGLASYDSDNDGKISPSEAKPLAFTIRGTR